MGYGDLSIEKTGTGLKSLSSMRIDRMKNTTMQSIPFQKTQYMIFLRRSIRELTLNSLRSQRREWVDSRARLTPNPMELVWLQVDQHHHGRILDSGYASSHSLVLCKTILFCFFLISYTHLNFAFSAIYSHVILWNIWPSCFHSTVKRGDANKHLQSHGGLFIIETKVKPLLLQHNIAKIFGIVLVHHNFDLNEGMVLVKRYDHSPLEI